MVAVMRDLLMVFVKFPEPGRVKTRLAKSVGNEEAARIYRALVARVFGQVIAPQNGGENQCWAIWIVFDPPERHVQIREWLNPLLGSGVDVDAYVPQVDGDLGARLSAAFSQGFAAGFDRVAAIGTDCVGFGAAEISECWRHLDENDVVFGPAADGGYYLIAMKREHPELFAGIPWSTAQTLAASRAAAAETGLAVAELAMFSDVDEIEQWEALCESGAGHQFEHGCASEPSRLPPQPGQQRVPEQLLASSSGLPSWQSQMQWLGLVSIQPAVLAWPVAGSTQYELDWYIADSVR